MNNLKTKVQSTSAGFTLIELLVVIGIIAILAAIVVVAINPSKQFAQARNTQREAAVSTILNAVGQNIADHKGKFECADESNIPVSNATSSAKLIGQASANIDLDECLVPTYIPSAIPVDPGEDSGGNPFDDDNTGYEIVVDSLGRYTVCSPEHAEPSVPGSAAYCLTR